MDRVEEIERRLEQLVPRGFSESGLASLEAMVDELAAAEDDPREKRRGWGLAVSAAAVLGVSLAGPWSSVPDSVAAEAPGVDEALVEEVAEGEEPELMAELEGVVAIEEDDSMLTDSDGSLHRAYHVQVAREERFRDSESGQEVRVMAQRDELVLMPVSSF